jgi:hypothetical protein
VLNGFLRNVFHVQPLDSVLTKEELGNSDRGIIKNVVFHNALGYQIVLRGMSPKAANPLCVPSEERNDAAFFAQETACIFDSLDTPVMNLSSTHLARRRQDSAPK